MSSSRLPENLADLKKPWRCPLHKDADVLENYQTGYIICTECLFIVDGVDNIDMKPEGRNYMKDESAINRSLVGVPENPLLKENSLCPLINPTGLVELSGQNYQIPVKANNDKALAKAYDGLKIMAARINITQNVINRAMSIYKKIYTLNKYNNYYCTDGRIAACLYLACRKEGDPRGIKEITAICKCSKKEIGRCYRRLVKDLNEDVEKIQSADFVSRFCSYLTLPYAIHVAAGYIAKKATELGLSDGRNPVSIAAAAIYMASQVTPDKRTQSQIADVVGVVEATINQAYRLLYPHREKLFSVDFKSKFPLDTLPPIVKAKEK